MRKVLIVSAILAAFGAAASVAQAALIRVDLTHQTMHVSSDQGEFDWPISSARSGFVTPRGTYGVQRLEAMHYSRKYHNSPMPHSIFFRGGYAIHGTYATASLGAPASHGCIRLAPENAAELYDIVRSEGARIAISGSPGEIRYARTEHRPRHAVETADDVIYDADGRPLRRPLAYAPDETTTQAPPGLGDWLRIPARGGWYRGGLFGGED